MIGRHFFVKSAESVSECNAKSPLYPLPRKSISLCSKSQVQAKVRIIRQTPSRNPSNFKIHTKLDGFYL